jgi:hypothetical protein
MADILERPSQEFKEAAAPQAKVPVQIDADVAEWLKSEFGDWHGEANSLLRFFMDNSQAKDREFSQGEPLPHAPNVPPPALA